MRLIFEIIIAVIIGGTLFALYCTAKRVLRTPVPVSEGTRVYILVTARGDAPTLEQTLDGLIWLRDNTLPSDIVVADCGLDAGAAKVVELLCRDNACITVCAPENITKEVTEWTRESLFK